MHTLRTRPVDSSQKLESLPLIRARDMEQSSSKAEWRFASLKGRVCELGAHGLSAIACIVADAQKHGHRCVWVQARDDYAYLPDLMAWSVDPSVIPFIRVSEGSGLASVLDRLISSAAFGLVVLDLDASMPWSSAMQLRLVRMVQHHDVALLCIRSGASSRSSLVDMRARGEIDSSACESVRIVIEKDKRHSGVRQYQEQCYGPAWMS